MDTNDYVEMTELGAVCARVLIVSSGWPTMTWAAPPTLPAMSSLIVEASMWIVCVEDSEDRQKLVDK